MDRQALYLQGLQSGYRIDEYQYTTLGLGETAILAPSNPNRVLIYIDPSQADYQNCFFRLQSGLLIAYFPNANILTASYSVANYYSVPSFEVIVTGNNPGQIWKGFGIVKN